MAPEMQVVCVYIRCLYPVNSDQVTSMYANMSVHLALLDTLLCNVHQMPNLMFGTQSRTLRDGLQISLNGSVSLSGGRYEITSELYILSKLIK